MYIIKDKYADEWFSRKDSSCKYPYFTSSNKAAKKYNSWFIAYIRSVFLGDCVVQKYMIEDECNSIKQG